MRHETTTAGSPRDLVSIDTTVAHTSRIYDFLLGGTDNFAVDREVAEHAFDAYPGGMAGARTDARANRAFLRRAVRYLAGEAGIRQFLDIGTGIPNADNTHAIARQIAPDARIVYVDNDPIVLAHAHALLQGTADGTAAFIDGDLRDPAALLDHAAAILDLTRPTAIVVVGVLHVLPDSDRPDESLAALVDAVPSGSYLALSHMTDDIQVAESDMNLVVERLDQRMHATNPPVLRTRAEITRFFDGLEILEPGVVTPVEWRPDAAKTNRAGTRVTPMFCGIARKP